MPHVLTRTRAVVGGGILAVLLLACFGAPVGAQAPGDMIRIGDLAPAHVVEYTWGILTTEQKDLLGVASLSEFRNLQMPRPTDLPAVTAGITEISRTEVFP